MTPEKIEEKAKEKILATRAETRKKVALVASCMQMFEEKKRRLSRQKDI